MFHLRENILEDNHSESDPLENNSNKYLCVIVPRSIADVVHYIFIEIC